MERILNSIAVGLVALCFVVSLGGIALRETKRKTVDGQKIIEIRLAHWQLEGGIREALDALGKEYSRLHPNVRISQIPIPERIYKNWLLTQLIGGTAPDIIQLGAMVSDERLARFFLSQTDVVDHPNPYNRGTALEKVPLRDTFFDGMAGSFSTALLEYYGIPLSAYTVRVYINLDLLREITGGEEIPRTYQEFLSLCDRTIEFSRTTGRTIIPVAGSRYNSPYLMNNLFASQTQKLVRELGPPGTFEFSAARLSNSYANDEWSLDTPAIRSGLKIMREVGQRMQPGFMQVGRDDASFYFMQGRALMIATGSWDSTSISQQARFPFRAFRIPLPDRNDPEYGKFTLGRTSEAGTNAGLTLGVTNTSKHPEVALDFLLFLASQPINQKFTDISGWLPSVVGVRPSERTADFMLLTDGYTQGFLLNPPGRADVGRVVNNAFHRLVAPEGSVEEFVELIRPGYIKALYSDMQRQIRTTRSGLQRLDVQLAGAAQLALLSPEDAAAARRLDMMIASANSQENGFYNQRNAARNLKTRIEKETSK